LASKKQCEEIIQTALKQAFGTEGGNLEFHVLKTDPVTQLSVIEVSKE